MGTGAADSCRTSDIVFPTKQTLKHWSEVSFQAGGLVMAWALISIADNRRLLSSVEHVVLAEMSYYNAMGKRCHPVRF